MEKRSHLCIIRDLIQGEEKTELKKYLFKTYKRHQDTEMEEIYIA